MRASARGAVAPPSPACVSVWGAGRRLTRNSLRAGLLDLRPKHSRQQSRSESHSRKARQKTAAAFVDVHSWFPREKAHGAGIGPPPDGRSSPDRSETKLTRSDWKRQREPAA